MTELNFHGAKFAAHPIFMAPAPDFVPGDSNSIARRALCDRSRRVVQQRCAWN